MELTIKDRLYIPSFLPKEGTFRDFNNKKEILRKIEISDNEREDIELKENGETRRIEWNNEKEIPLYVDFSNEEVEYLKKSCEKIADENLPDEMWLSIEKLYNGDISADE